MKKAIFYIAVVAVTFALLEPIGSLPAFSGVSAFVITAVRFAIGSALLLPFSISALKRRRLRLSGRDWLMIAGLGILVICVSMNLLQLAVQTVREAGKTPANIAIIFCSNSLLTILLSVWLLHDPMTGQKLLATGLGTIGLCFCVDFSGRDGLRASLLALAAAATFSLYTVLTKKYAARFSGVIQTGFSFLIGSVVLILALVLMGDTSFQQIGPKNLPHMLLLGVVVTGIGYAAYFRAIECWSVMAASLAFFIKPVLTPFTTWLIRGQAFAPADWKLFIAIGFVILGSAVALIPAQRFGTPLKRPSGEF